MSGPLFLSGHEREQRQGCHFSYGPSTPSGAGRRAHVDRRGARLLVAVLRVTKPIVATTHGSAERADRVPCGWLLDRRFRRHGHRGDNSETRRRSSSCETRVPFTAGRLGNHARRACRRRLPRNQRNTGDQGLSPHRCRPVHQAHRLRLRSGGSATPGCRRLQKRSGRLARLIYVLRRYRSDTW